MMTTSTRTRGDESGILQDVEAVLADVLSDFAEEPHQSLRSIVKSMAKETVKAALLGAFEGLVEAATSMFRSGGVAVSDYIVGIVHRIRLLLLQALEALNRLLRPFRGRGSEEVAPLEPGDEGDHDRDEDMQFAGR